MSLPNYLAQIKSSGIYRFVWDKSEIAGVPAETLRLVVGYSEKGPFNTPVYLESEAEFKSVFGDISKKLEKRGVFFHRMAIQCLGKGPILALNLKKFENEKVNAVSFNTLDAEIKTLEVPVESIYDTTRFWKLDPESILPATQNAKVTTGNKYISITSADSKETSCSIFIRGYKPTGYDVTVSNWYSSMGEEIPDFFVTENEDYSSLLVSDFFAEIYVFRGEFTKALCATEPLSRYFNWDSVDNRAVLKNYIEDAFGNKIDTLSALASDESSNFVNSYSGCLLPYFRNQVGSYISLDLLFNADNNRHKMMMNFNSDLLYSGDVTIDQLVTTAWESNTAFGTILTPSIQTYTWNETKEDFVYSSVETPFEPNFIEYIGSAEHKLDFVALGFEKGDRVLAEVYSPAEVITVTAEAVGASIEANTEDITIITEGGQTSDGGVKLDGGDYFEVSGVLPGDQIIVKMFTTKSNGEGGFIINGTTHAYSLAGSVDTASNVEYTIKDADLIGGILKIERSRSEDRYVSITVIHNKKGEKIDNNFWVVSEVSGDALEVVSLTGVESIISGANTVKKCNYSCSVTNNNLSPIYFEGYVYEHDKPVIVNPETNVETPSTRDIAKLNWHNFLLGTLTDYEGIRTALTNRTDIDYRYIIDTFEGLVDTELHKELALIAKEKDNAVAFLNFPSVKTFKNCTYSSFTDDKGRFQVKYIKEGANKQKQHAKLFSLVSEINGASYVSYNTPLIFTDGAVKTEVPSAALVSNNFMDKYTSRQPYYVVAGPTYGRMIWSGMVGPDYNFTRADLDILEPMGVNCMVYVPRLGTYINSNQTAKQNPVTALSKLNIRELVIYLQDQIEALLQDYQWEFNTPYLRDLIKAKADTICERIKNNGGLYQYLNVCDESNNTDDVINNEMFILSTSIEPGMGAGKMIHELTIYRKGQMSSLIK